MDCFERIGPINLPYISCIGCKFIGHEMTLSKNGATYSNYCHHPKVLILSKYYFSYLNNQRVKCKTGNSTKKTLEIIENQPPKRLIGETDKTPKWCPEIRKS